MESSEPADEAFAVVHDVAASWEDYHLLKSATVGVAMPGLIVHAAGPTDDGFRTIEVWASRDAWHCRQPHLEHLFDGLAAPPVVRELRVDHLVIPPVDPDIDSP